jgi:hypothetical protein
MTRASRGVALGAAVMAALATCLALLTPSARAAQCFNDGKGYATHGILQGTESLDVGYINESRWSGNHTYDADRHYSNGNWSYSVTVVGGGPHQYGTSGNVYRYSAIFSAQLLTSWSVTQWSIC